MTVSKRWTEFSLKLHALTAQAAGAVYVDGIRQQSLNQALSTRLEGADGAAYNTFGSLVSGAPVARFSTSDLAVMALGAGDRRAALGATTLEVAVPVYTETRRLVGVVFARQELVELTRSRNAAIRRQTLIALFALLLLGVPGAPGAQGATQR